MIASRMKRIDLSLVLPCYNETVVFEESVRTIIETLKHSNYSFEIIFVDDGSSDATPSHIRSTCRKYRFCRAIFHKRNMGRGKAVSDGMLKACGEAVGYMDIDCEVSPIYIPECIDLILKKQADVVVGKRIYRTTFHSIIREVLSLGYQWLSDWMIGTKRIDTESGYKFFNRKAILSVLAQTSHPHWFWDTEIVVRSLRNGLTVKEVPVLFLRRFDKTSSVHVIRDIIDYLVSLWTFKHTLSREKGRRSDIWEK
jgi:glycosyltransferase involved in cell wall biosynthesis